MLIELRQAPISYWYYRMLLLAIAGPDLDLYHCHPLYASGGGERDYMNQQCDSWAPEISAS